MYYIILFLCRSPEESLKEQQPLGGYLDFSAFVLLLIAPWMIRSSTFKTNYTFFIRTIL